MFKKMFLLFALMLSATANANNLRFSLNDADFYFTAKFLKTVFENKKDNFVISPLSVYTVTTFLANGADGNTRVELDEILNEPKLYYGNPPALSMDVLNKNLSAYITQKKNTIKMTNTIAGKDFRPDYVEKMERELFAVLDKKMIDFGKIELTNTVDFEDFWVKPFKNEKTSVKEFHSIDGQIDKVNMMHDYERFVDYYQDEKMQAIRLPYRGGNVMHIFLPKEGVNFEDFIKNLNAWDLYLEYRSLPTEIFLPRFAFNHEENDMISFYKQWGIKDVFSKSNSNLSKLSDTPYYVYKITHKVKIKTDEIGTKAEAFTGAFGAGLGDTLRGALEPRKWKMIFNANRPFVFMINNGDFIGVYVKGELLKE